MALRVKRNVKPIDRLPQANRVDPSAVKTLLEYYNELTENGIFKPAWFDTKPIVLVGADAPMRASRDEDFIFRGKLWSSLWPATFGMKFEQLGYEGERTLNGLMFSDRGANNWLTAHNVTHVFAQSVGVDIHETGMACVQVSAAINIRDNRILAKKIMGRNARHKVFGIVTDHGGVVIAGISMAHIRLVNLLNSYKDKYGHFPSPLKEKLDEQSEKTPGNLAVRRNARKRNADSS